MLGMAEFGGLLEQSIVSCSNQDVPDRDDEMSDPSSRSHDLADCSDLLARAGNSHRTVGKNCFGIAARGAAVCIHHWYDLDVAGHFFLFLYREHLDRCALRLNEDHGVG